MNLDLDVLLDFIGPAVPKALGADGAPIPFSTTADGHPEEPHYPARSQWKRHGKIFTYLMATKDRARRRVCQGMQRSHPDISTFSPSVTAARVGHHALNAKRPGTGNPGLASAWSGNEHPLCYSGAGSRKPSAATFDQTNVHKHQRPLGKELPRLVIRPHKMACPNDVLRHM